MPPSPHPSSEVEAVNASDSDLVANLTASQGLLFGYLNTLLPGDPEVSDILQRANLVIWEKRANFISGSSFRKWALSIAYWEARAWMTTSKRKAWLIFDEDLASATLERFVAEPLEDADYSHRMLTTLQLCLSKLKDSDRIIVFQYYQRGKSLSESGKTFNRSADSLKVSLHRIRAALKRCITANLTTSALKE